MNVRGSGAVVTGAGNGIGALSRAGWRPQARAWWSTTVTRPPPRPGRRGRFVITASAAGLLTMLGTAPYSVTQARSRATVAGGRYGHRGLHVHCVCPQGVRTSMLAGSAGPGRHHRAADLPALRAG